MNQETTSIFDSPLSLLQLQVLLEKAIEDRKKAEEYLRKEQEETKKAEQDCNKSTKYLKGCNEIRRINNEINNYKCPICIYKLSDDISFRIISYDIDELLSSVIDSFYFENEFSIRKNEIYRIINKFNNYKCPICTYKLNKNIFFKNISYDINTMLSFDIYLPYFSSFEKSFSKRKRKFRRTLLNKQIFTM